MEELTHYLTEEWTYDLDLIIYKLSPNSFIFVHAIDKSYTFRELEKEQRRYSRRGGSKYHLNRL